MSQTNTSGRTPLALFIPGANTVRAMAPELCEREDPQTCKGQMPALNCRVGRRPHIDHSSDRSRIDKSGRIFRPLDGTNFDSCSRAIVELRISSCNCDRFFHVDRKEVIVTHLNFLPRVKGGTIASRFRPSYDPAFWFKRPGCDELSACPQRVNAAFTLSKELLMLVGR